MSRRAVILLVLTGVVAVFFAFVQHNAAAPLGNNPPDTSALFTTSFWNERIQELGADDAYAYFKRQADALPEKEDSLAAQHIAAHFFGDALYGAVGPDAILVCDESFGYGCFHQVLLNDIGVRGVEAAHQLAAACVDRYGPDDVSCRHGIGHGLLDYFGPDALEPALDVCAELDREAPILGCRHGVFMEYFFPAQMDVSAGRTAGIRQPEDYMQSICPLLSPSYRPQCYFSEIGWRVSQGAEYAEAGSYCRALPGHEQPYCWSGLGDTITERAAFRSDDAVSGCSDAAMSHEETEYCRAGIHWAFWKLGFPAARKTAETLCATDGENRCAELTAVWTASP